LLAVSESRPEPDEAQTTGGNVALSRHNPLMASAPDGRAGHAQPLIEHGLELAGYRTRALELEGNGPPLVLLHGYADSADTWRLVLDLLARRGRRAIALDMPGFGAAERLRGHEPVLPQLDAFAAAAVEHVAGEHGHVVLVGNSLGGCVALRAAQDPDLPVAGAVPVAPAGFDHPRWFQILERDPILRRLVRSPLPLPELAVRAVVGQMYRALVFARPLTAEAGVVTSFTNHHRSRDAVASYLDTGRRLLPELSACFELSRIEAPVLLVWGERDRMVTHRGSRHVLEALPSATYELMDGVGHCPQVEAPRRLVRLLERFVASLGAGTRAG
jgi:pimeloyl-ACP methyl ester carboxylesterase